MPVHEPVLLLLHGLGGTGAVWEGVVGRWPGRALAPDLPGHGGAEPLQEYTFHGLAAAVAAQLDPELSYVVLGHSLGGVVALALADPRHGLQVDRVVGLGIKVVWSESDLQRAAALAARPSAVFAERHEAADRHLAVSGLRGLVTTDHAAVRSGLRQVDGGWRLALDLRAFGVGAPDLPALLGAARAEVLLARGEHDPMVSEADLASLPAPYACLPGLGHSPHVEDPSAVLAMLVR